MDETIEKTNAEFRRSVKIAGFVFFGLGVVSVIFAGFMVGFLGIGAVLAAPIMFVASLNALFWFHARHRIIAAGKSQWFGLIVVGLALVSIVAVIVLTLVEIGFALNGTALH